MNDVRARVDAEEWSLVRRGLLPPAKPKQDDAESLLVRGLEMLANQLPPNTGDFARDLELEKLSKHSLSNLKCVLDAGFPLERPLTDRV
jgi:hypothetical protein